MNSDSSHNHRKEERERERERGASAGRGGGCTGQISVVKKIKQNIWPSTDDTHSFDNLHS